MHVSIIDGVRTDDDCACNQLAGLAILLGTVGVVSHIFHVVHVVSTDSFYSTYICTIYNICCKTLIIFVTVRIVLMVVERWVNTKPR